MQSPEEGTRHHGAVVAGCEPPKLGGELNLNLAPLQEQCMLGTTKPFLACGSFCFTNPEASVETVPSLIYFHVSQDLSQYLTHEKHPDYA